jgi:tetratricopeptide (TPR) repeat protein
MSAVADQTRALLRQAWALRKVPDPKGMVALLSPVTKDVLSAELELAHLLSWGLRELGEFQKSLDLQLELEDRFRRRGNDWLLRWWLLVAGVNWLETGRAGQARWALLECMDLAEQADDQYSLAWASNNLGGVAALLGQYDEALPNYRRSIAANHRRGYLRGLAIGHHNIADAHLESRRFDDAVENIGLAIDYSRTAGNLLLVRWHETVRAKIYIEVRDYPTARALLDRAELAFRRAGLEQQLSSTLALMGTCARLDGREQSAMKFLTGSMAIASKLQARLQQAITLVELGLLHDARQNSDSAVGALSEAREILTQFGGTYLLDRRVDQLSATTREKLSNLAQVGGIGEPRTR